ncbi:MAG: MarR family winged helix-turn-helix transcriptional regulator [Solirubrobacteraceae bacterium]
MTSATRTPAAAVDEAWALMWQLVSAQRPRFVAVAREHDLFPPQAAALDRLDPQQPVAMSELAGKLFCDPSNVTGIVDRLEARGLVERVSAPHDRRVKMLQPTPAGARLRAKVHAAMSAPPAELTALSARDADALRAILRRALPADR